LHQLTQQKISALFFAKRTRRRSAIDTKTSIDVACSTQLSKSYRPQGSLGSPFWGKSGSRRRAYRKILLGVSTSTTLKSSCLTEQFPILRAPDSPVKGAYRIILDCSLTGAMLIRIGGLLAHPSQRCSVDSALSAHPVPHPAGEKIRTGISAFSVLQGAATGLWK